MWMFTLTCMTHCFSARTKFLLAALISLQFISSCKKDLNSVGAEIIGVRNGFATVFDTTMSLNTYTVEMDTVNTGSFLSYAIGKLNDPETGISEASLNFQYNLPANNFSWEGATKLDSVVLQLRYRDLTALYGDKDQVHTLKVYALDEDLNIDSSYYSNREFKVKPTEYGSWTGKFNLNDTLELKLGSSTFRLPPHIRIKMNANFESLLFGAESRGEFSSSSNFKTAFKGFKVVDETNLSGSEAGAIAYIRFNTDVTALTAYYKDTLAADFNVVSLSEVTTNTYKFNRKPGLIQKSFQGTHRDTCYVQGIGGTKVRIELPELAKTAKPNLAINGAELVLNVLAGSNSTTWGLPGKLQLVGSDSLGRNIFIKDLAIEGAAYYGGLLNTSYNQYRFNIARHMQYLINEYKQNRNVNYGLYLFVPFSETSASRVLLDTRKNSGAIKLKLTYTVIN